MTDTGTKAVQIDGTAPAPPAPRSKERRSVRRDLQGEFSRLSGFGIWGIFILIFAIWTPTTFLSSSTFKSIAGTQSVTVILAVGLLCTLAAGEFDLSIGQNLGTSAVLVSWLMAKHNMPPVLAVLITIAFGAMVGAVNGVITTQVKISSFIGTLAMSSVLLALAEILSDYKFIGPVDSSFQRASGYTPLGVPILAIYAIGLSVFAWYVLEHTPAGRRLYATGANADAARLAGVKTQRYKFWSFVITGLFGATAGCLVASQFGEVSSTVGPSYLLPAFAACFLGATQFKIGRFNVWGTVMALYLLETGVKGLQLVGGPLWVTDLFNGLVLLIAVGVAVVSGRRRAGRVHGAKQHRS